MKTVKTARGKTLNMGQLAEEFERTRAVSNVPVNAKGDIIDARGDVKVPREKISKEYYRDNLQGVEESVSIKVDDDEPVVITPTQEVKEETKPKPKETPKPKSAPVVAEEEEVVEIGRRERTRDDGTKYWEVEFSDGSMTTEDNGDV
mgnify:FL=1